MQLFQKNERRYSGIGLLGIILAMIVGIFVFPIQSFAAQIIIPGDFESLKAAIEDPQREQTLVIPAGRYIFTDTITVSKDLVLQNPQGEKVEFVLGMFNMQHDQLGKTMLHIVDGTVTFDGDQDENFVFDGTSQWDIDHYSSDRENLDHVTNFTNVTKNGVFVTVGPKTKAIINHATFTKASNQGALTGAIFVDYKASLVMNGGQIVHNFLTMGQTSANYQYFNARTNPNGYATRSASIALYGASFEMFGGKIHDNYSIYGSGSAISSAGTNVAATTDLSEGLVHSTITIHQGEISLNSSHTFGDQQDAHGGAILANANTDTVIEDGLFQDNYAHGGGGFIFNAWVTSLKVNGGTFKGNMANRGGGAIATFDGFATYDESNDKTIYGEINQYGIDNIDDWYAYGFGTKLQVNGGNFIENKAYMGGAIYVASDHAEINAGKFTKNEANRFGGAIYLSTVPYRMTIRNAYIANNHADESYGTLGSDYYPDMDPSIYHTGSGGGVWYCPTGSGKVNISNGVAIFDNDGTIEGDDFASMAKEAGKDYRVSLVNRMLGGGWVDWYGDFMDHRYTEADQPHQPLQDVAQDLMLKSKTSTRSKRAAKSVATTIFTDNRAKRGGAIGTNGHIDFGDGQLEFDLSVQKTWDSSIAQQEPIEVQLLIVKDDKEYEVDRAILSQDNGYMYTFKGLPLESNGKMTYRVHEVTDQYQTTYAYHIGDQDIINDDSFSTADLIHQDHVYFEIHNSPKPEPTIQLEVKKQWDDAIVERNPITFQLKRLIDGQIDQIIEMELNQANGYRHVFLQQPIQKDGKKITYQVEELGDQYQVQYTYQIADQPIVALNAVNVGDLEAGSHVVFTMINQNKPPLEPSSTLDPKPSPTPKVEVPNTADPFTSTKLFIAFGLSILIGAYIMIYQMKKHRDI